jgi:hypothetical protein
MAVTGEARGWVIPAECVRMIPEPVRVGPPPPQGAAEEPTIVVHRENGVVRAVDLTCVCGRTYRIWWDEELSSMTTTPQPSSSSGLS